MLGFGRLMLLAAVGFLSVAPTTAPAAENEAGTGAEANAEVPLPEIKNCSWCHGAYGMTADKGPRLAGTKMTEEEVRERSGMARKTTCRPLPRFSPIRRSRRSPSTSSP